VRDSITMIARNAFRRDTDEQPSFFWIVVPDTILQEIPRIVGRAPVVDSQSDVVAADAGITFTDPEI
jgi:hypothetical protein